MKPPLKVQIQEKVNLCRNLAAQRDHEGAHAKEDELRAQVLKAIAGSRVDRKTARALAKLALSTDEIEFQRSCA